MILTKIQEASTLYPDNIALQTKTAEGYRKYTYRDVVRIIASTAQSLRDRGIRRGDRVAVFSENRPEWIFAYLSVAAMGAVVVPWMHSSRKGSCGAALQCRGNGRLCVRIDCTEASPQRSSYRHLLRRGSGISFADLVSARLGTPLPPAPEPGTWPLFSIPRERRATQRA